MHRYLFVLFIAILSVACAQPTPTPWPTSTPATTATPIPTPDSESISATITPSGLQIKDLVVGDGAEAAAGASVSVNYTGWLMDGTMFDSSIVHGRPFTFVLGKGSVIQGWDEGVAGMRVGGKRELVIPPDLAYGDRGAGGTIPPGATLKFEVELLGVK